MKKKATPGHRRAKPGSAPKHPGADGDSLMRINRFLSTSGVTSRRKADELVLQGRVSVNGVVVEELGTRVDPRRDKIFVDGKQALRVHDFLYLVLNKPKDTITTISDERGRATVMDLVRTRERVYPVGRLDRKTTGVLLLTNDGEFAHHLMHPRFDVPKMYMVTCDRAVAREDLQRLRHGVPLADGLSTAAEVFAVPGTRGLGVAVTLHEGRNRQVRRMFEHLGYMVEKLDRVGYGPVTIEGLPRGQVRALTHEEIRALRELAGITADD